MTHNEQSGFDPALYDMGFYVWTQRQAAAMRAMPREAAGREIDIDHLAEEIEDLGKRDLREVESIPAVRMSISSSSMRIDRRKYPAVA